MQTKPLAIYMGSVCFVVAGVGGATWASFHSSKAESPLFLQSAEVSYRAPPADWPAPSQARTDTRAVAYLNEWMALVAPSAPHETAPQPQQASDNAAVSPREVVRDVSDEAAKDKAAKTKAAPRRRRHERSAAADEDERIQTTGQGSASSEHANEPDRRAYQSRRTRENRRDRDEDDDDRTVGLHDRREPPEVRVVPVEPVPRGGGLFGFFGPFHD